MPLEKLRKSKGKVADEAGSVTKLSSAHAHGDQEAGGHCREGGGAQNADREPGPGRPQQPLRIALLPGRDDCAVGEHKYDQ